MSNEKQKLYGVQFHPEVGLTENGQNIFKNFVHDIAKCKGNYTMKSREEACIEYIKETVGNHKVLVCMNISFLVIKNICNIVRSQF